MIPAIQSAMQGMHRNQQNMTEHAHRIANFGKTGPSSESPPVSLPEEMVGMMVSQRGFEANIPVIRAADEMLGSLIDILA